MQNSSSDIIEFLEENKQCSYFPDKIADIRYRYIQNQDTKTYIKMLHRGWRRFGYMNFVPECKTCNECKTIRIDTLNYKFSKNEKRVLKRNQDIQVYIQKPSLSMEHINLFNKYHQYMTEKKQWDENIIDPVEYQASYVDGAGEFGKEILYFLDDKLVCVALCDMTDDSFSSVYCYYDHDYEKRSLGKFSILVQIYLAKQAKVPYLFLGYWIKDHYSMGYKEDYAPFEVLQNRPTLDEECVWAKYIKNKSLD